MLLSKKMVLVDQSYDWHISTLHNTVRLEFTFRFIHYILSLRTVWRRASVDTICVEHTYL
jgi:hypothetical protein